MSKRAGFSIEVKDVSFAYPGTSNLALDHVSFEIKNGETISFVGLNGAGKTTLIKLLCRFYRPSSGEILVNGVSIYDYSAAEYMEQIGSIFQDFKLFPVSIKNNVSFHEDGKKVASILSLLGMERVISRWPDGVDSFYDRTFSKEGIGLSGGEAQKIALARALIRDAGLIILDEPTSTLDPIAEADFYENLRANTKGRTTIFVSHRMSSSVFSDRIFVFSNGKLEAQGSHEELMKEEKGLYYELFTHQAKGYQETDLIFEKA